MPMQNLHDLFEHELKDIYAAEQQLLSTMQKMLEDSRDDELKSGLRRHADETKDQISRIENVFKSLNVERKGAHCPAVEGMAKEVQEFRKMDPAVELVDPFNVGASIKGERYEISAYESILDMAQKLGIEDVAAPLQQNLQEEVAQLERLKTVSRRLSGPVSAGDAAQKPKHQRPA